MEYQALYRRYRPRRFADLRGQEHVVRALRNAVRDGRVAHAYLLSGPRGTGKTTLARILAKALNCTALVDGEPCGECASCLSIDAGTSFDLHELDAASNNKVDDIRDLLAKVALGTPGRTKVYLLDEVHMLTAGAENALLKTLEEPPAHVVFVLATTEPHKVVATIPSRTQHLELSLIPADELRELVDFVVADAGLAVTPEAIDYVLEAGGGSARDTLSALDQVVAAGGVAHESDAVEGLLHAIADRDVGRAMGAVADALARGREPRVIGERALSGLRNVFLVTMGLELAHAPDRERAQAAELSRRFSAARLTLALETLGSALVDMRQAPDPRVDLEVAVVRITRDPVSETGSDPTMMSRIEELERRIAQLESAPAVSPAPSLVSPGGAAPPPPAPVPASPGLGRSSRPADSARRQLDRSGSRAAPPPVPRAAAPGRTPPSVRPSLPQPVASPNEPPTPVSATESSSGEASGSLGGSLTWPEPLEGVRKVTRALYQAARVVSQDAVELVLALPNAVHQRRCEDARAEVEAELTRRAGSPMRVRLVVDDAPAAPESAAGRAKTEADEEIDLDDLRDADNVDSGLLSRLTAAFPGAEVIDKD